MIGRSAVPDLDGVLTADEVVETATSIAALQLPYGHDPVVPRRPLRPVEPRRDGHGPRRRRPPRPRPSGPTSGCCTMPTTRRQLVQLLPAPTGRRGRQARHQRLRLRRHRRVAPLADHRGPGLRRAPVADRPAGHRLGARRCRPTRGEIVWAREVDAPAVELRAAHRLVVDRPRAATARCAWPSWSASPPRLGAAPVNASADVDPHPARRVRAEGALGDGLVLPGAVPACSSAPQAEHRLAAAWDTFVMAGLGVRCVSDEPWVTAAETAECAIAHAVAGRQGHGDRPAARGPAPTAATTARTGPASSTPSGVHFPAGERTAYTGAAVILAADAISGDLRGQRHLHRRRPDPGA